jgi:hypothetical protein
MIDLNRNCAGMPRRDFLQLGIGMVLGPRLPDLRQEIAIRLEQLARGKSPPWDGAMLKDKLRRQYSRTTP